MTKLQPKDAEKALTFYRRRLRKLRLEMQITRNPDAVQRYIDFARLEIICAKRGIML